MRRLAGAVLRSEWGSTQSDDRDIAQFEHAFADVLGSAHCTPFAFARSAWRATLEVLDLARVRSSSPFTLPPMGEAPGLRPVFPDLAPDTLAFSVDQFRRANTDRTGAAMLTYLFGMASEPAPIVDTCRKRSVVLVEDFSHALGAWVAGRRMERRPAARSASSVTARPSPNGVESLGG